MGKVSWAVYLKFFKSMGYCIFAFCVCLYAVGSSVHALGDFVLSAWADANGEHPEDAQQNNKDYLLMYGVIGIIYVLCEFSRELIHYTNCAKAAEAMHAGLLRGVMRSPMSFFDTTPNGRVVNRFSADVNTIDQTIPNQINDMLWCLFDVVAVIVVICVAIPFFAIVVIPMFVIYYFVQKYYISTSRQLKRLESIAKSPIFAHFSETVQGAPSIRAYKEGARQEKLIIIAALKQAS